MPVDYAGDLDAGIRGKIRDQGSVVRDVADEQRLLAGDDRMDDHRGVFAAPLDLEGLARGELSLRLLEFVKVSSDPGQVLADRDVEPADLALRDEPRVVLGVMLRRLGG